MLKNPCLLCQPCHCLILDLQEPCRRRFPIKGSLSKDIFERHTSIKIEDFSLLICLGTTKLVLVGGSFTLKETICSRMWAKPLPKNAKSPLPVEAHRSKPSLLKLPNLQSHVRFYNIRDFWGLLLQYLSMQGY